MSRKSQPNLNVFSAGAVKGQENGKRLIMYHFKKEARGNTKNYNCLKFA